MTGTSAGSISLAWNDSTDNVGVSGYKVYEGTTVVATSPTASATISGLTSGSTHSYTVTAVDSAGNESGHSATVTGTATGGTTGPTADQLLAKVTACSQISNGKYKTDSDVSTATVAVCEKTGAVFWKGDMDIDCDGVRTTQCNEDTDCCFQPETFCQTSSGGPLNAAQLPTWSCRAPAASGTTHQGHRLRHGGGGRSTTAKCEYAVMGDTGPTGSSVRRPTVRPPTWASTPTRATAAPTPA